MNAICKPMAYDKNRHWHGVDASNKENLEEYGLLMRWRPEWQQFEAVLLIGFDDDENRLYTYGSFDFEGSWNELPDKRKQDLYSMCGMTEEEYKNCMSPVGLANDLLCLMSIYDVFSISAYEEHYTGNEIRRKLGRALCA